MANRPEYSLHTIVASSDWRLEAALEDYCEDNSVEVVSVVDYIHSHDRRSGVAHYYLKALFKRVPETP